MNNRENIHETDNKEKYYEHLTYPNLGNEGMSPLIKLLCRRMQLKLQSLL